MNANVMSKAMIVIDRLSAMPPCFIIGYSALQDSYMIYYAATIAVATYFAGFAEG